MKFVVSIALLGIGFFSSMAKANQLQYFVSQTLQITYLDTSATGKIQILKDARLRGAKTMPTDKFTGGPIEYRNALLRLLDSNGEKVAVQSLARPWASIRRSKLNGPGQVFEVTVNYISDIGSYQGPVTSFVCVNQAKLNWLEAVDAIDGTSRRISLLNGYHGIYKIKDSQTILKASATVDDQGTGGIEELARISLENGRWVIHRKSRPGASEFEAVESLPKESDYP